MAHISISNSKLGSIPSINLPPIVTCRSDAPCKQNCYACKGRFCFRNVKKNMELNYAEWRNAPREFTKSVIDACANVRFFRWHATGDIPDVNYLKMMCWVANLCPEVHFLCFTKKYELVDAYTDECGIPENLNIVYSAWGNLIPENPHNFPIAHVRLKSGEGAERIPEGAIPCAGRCDKCISGKFNCWMLKPGMSVVFNQH